MGTLSSELGPHVERLVTRPRVYADANLPSGVIGYMRDRLGWDVLAVVDDDDLRRASDLEHYRTARRLRRTLVTLDDDFTDAQQFSPEENPGVVVLSAPDEVGLVRLLKKVARAFFSKRRPDGLLPGQPLIGRTLQVHPDWEPPPGPRRRRRRRPKKRPAPAS